MWLSLPPVAGLFVLATARQPTARAALLTALFGVVCMVLACSDLESRVIPNRIVYPSLALAIALAPAWPGQQALGALGGAVAAAAPLACVSLLTRGGMGAGDVKMAALIGAVVGYPAALSAVAVAGAVGALTTGLALVTFEVRPGAAVPYAPFLAIGGAVALLLR